MSYFCEHTLQIVKCDPGYVWNIFKAQAKATGPETYVYMAHGYIRITVNLEQDYDVFQLLLLRC